MNLKFRGVADFFGGGDPFGEEDGIPAGRFRSQYRCYSVAMYGGNYREDVDNGGKSKTTYHSVSLQYFTLHYQLSCLHLLWTN